ncbi:MAG: nickel pincer cofactor biosynthesis protein LarB, partial [Kiritimatiellia bacterium]
MNLEEMLREVEAGRLTAEEALRQLEPAEKNLGFARVDTDRLQRRGMPEVIFCPGKTPQQIAVIMTALKTAGQNVFATRAS